MGGLSVFSEGAIRISRLHHALAPVYIGREFEIRFTLGLTWA
jgi:hypothetical protein